MRGIVGETITAETVRATGAAFVDVLGLEGQTILVGGDMRPSSPEFMDAFAQGATARGANVEKIGLISTDVLYFACGVENAAGVTFTASHNPAEYNGMKMSKAGAVPLSSESGLFDIRDLAQKYLDSGEIPSVEKVGTVSEKDVLKPYAEYLRKLVDLSSIRPLKVVVDAGNGMGGMTTPAVLGDTILPACPWKSFPCTSSWTVPSRTTRLTRWNRLTWLTCRRLLLSTVLTLVWHSTATLTVASSSTRRVSPSLLPL